MNGEELRDAIRPHAVMVECDVGTLSALSQR
jgi:hypothetical protein